MHDLEYSLFKPSAAEVVVCFSHIPEIVQEGPMD